MMVEVQSKRYTPDEYLELETRADSKNEYRNGEILPMTVGSVDHNKIAGNLYVYLKLALRQQPYNLFIGDVRLWIPAPQVFTYPDVMLIEGEPIFYGERTDTVTNPQMIIEVLSKSTRNYDQGDKFDAYRTISQFQEYVLIDQYQFHVKQFSKTVEGYWLLKEYQEVQQSLVFTSIDYSISLVEIYEGVRIQEV
ncbi:Uma2 family endonuclease [Spirulina subsalsa FACHB-351]|uniref:Uma2 family endonuclease n=1 Tax=Spirulina subsalsa FACHB-351 TaxID=234711 RepID=A0ABT3KZS5_9CYAN|nr:Uma2 family endonuclease [Spirulina subsalsa]MCW6034759.1 Uma2 family endonuclease [Spirulina subsalsa FACHB-351]